MGTLQRSSLTIEDKMVLDLFGSVELYKRSTHIEIVFRWFGFSTLIWTAAAVGWAIYLAHWYLSGQPIIVSPASIRFPMHVLVSLSFAYAALAYWLNRTHIVVGMGSLKTWHGPIPWPGRKDIPLSEVKQITAVDVVHQNSGDTHELNVVLRSGGAVTLLRNLHSLKEAQAIEKHIEKYLQIKDQPQTVDILGPDKVDLKQL